VDPISLDIRLIKAVLGAELRITPGRALAARVVATDGRGRGVITIAGEPLEAELPEHVQPGQELKLYVRDVSAERVVLSLSQDVPSPALSEVPLPGGGTIRISEEDEQRGGGSPPGTHTLALRYDAPRLGPVDLRFELAAGSLRVAVALSAGEALERGQAQAEELRGALGDAVAGPVTVAIQPRHDPLDLYA
jgi:hypothetical protein